jgi:hypothetical protein
LAIGFLVAVSRAVSPPAPGVLPAAGWTRAVLDSALCIMAFGLAGWAAAIGCRVAGTLILHDLARPPSGQRARTSDARRAPDEREVAPLDHAEHSPHGAPLEAAVNQRTAALAALERAMASDLGTGAESLLHEFAEQFPDDRALAELQTRMAARRLQQTERQISQLQAARQVNDPARVLELYQVVVASLDSPTRGDLERDLARWFLALIQRRLRIGKIQADVVVLATQVAETFATTVEGASLRASLPTLRRSVGLCPRCASPYTGLGEACPKCLAAGPSATLRESTEHGSIQP